MKKLTKVYLLSILIINLSVGYSLIPIETTTAIPEKYNDGAGTTIFDDSSIDRVTFPSPIKKSWGKLVQVSTNPSKDKSDERRERWVFDSDDKVTILLVKFQLLNVFGVQELEKFQIEKIYQFKKS